MELLALNIKQNPSINGNCVGSVMIKLCQFADDMTLLLRDVNSLKEVFVMIEQFSICSGLKLNVNKTQGMVIGSRAEIGVEQLPPIYWDNKINILGIVYSYDIVNINSNFQSIVDKAKSNIKCWYGRHLTMYGKIVLIKSLVCSLLQYVGHVYVIPDVYIKEL